jgi:hypothetical protein
MSRFVTIAGAAATFILVALVGYNLLPSIGGVGGPGKTASPTATPAASPTATAPPSVLTLPTGSVPVPLVAGTYLASAPFTVKVGFTLPEGWQGNVGGPYFLAIERATPRTGGIYLSVLGNVYADACHSERGLASPPIGPTERELVTALTHLSGVTASTPVDVTIAGYAATSFTLTPAVSPATCTGGTASLWQLPLGSSINLSAGQTDRILVFTVGATRIAAEVAGYDTQAPSMVAEVQAVLDSMTIAR